jgi:hypothetical protein
MILEIMINNKIIYLNLKMKIRDHQDLLKLLVNKVVTLKFMLNKTSPRIKTFNIMIKELTNNFFFIEGIILLK